MAADGIERVLEQLLEQRAALDDVLQRQEQLSSLVRAQHRELYKRLQGAPSDFEWNDADFNGDDDDESDDTQDGPDDERVEQSSENYPPPVQTTGKLPLPVHQTCSDVKSESDSAMDRGRSLRSLASMEAMASQAGTCYARVKKVVAHPAFEASMGAVIMLNFAAVFVELQWKGYESAHNLGLRDDDNGWTDAKIVFSGLEKAFNACFLLELFFRILVFRREFFVDPMNLADAAIVLLSSVDSFVLDFVNSDAGASKLGVFARLIRVTRALRLLRFLRVLRFMGLFTSLRVLVKTISKSMDALFWSMALLGFIILAVSMLVVQLTSDFLNDDEVQLKKRVWMYEHFGSSGRASYSMFEATFTAKWATHLSRPLIDDVSPAFSIFWILYTVAVNFAVVRVVSALFLKQTMEVAAIDHNVRVRARMRENEKIMHRLEEIFDCADQDKNGVLHKWEFEDMMSNPDCLDLFTELELDSEDLLMLFNLLAEDDGVVDQEEFLSGVMKLKSSVRTVDMIQVQHDQSVIKAGMEHIKAGITRVDATLHPNSSWRATSPTDPDNRKSNKSRERKRRRARFGPGLGRTFARSFSADTDANTLAVVAGA